MKDTSEAYGPKVKTTTTIENGKFVLYTLKPDNSVYKLDNLYRTDMEITSKGGDSTTLPTTYFYIIPAQQKCGPTQNGVCVDASKCDSTVTGANLGDNTCNPKICCNNNNLKN